MKRLLPLGLFGVCSSLFANHHYVWVFGYQDNANWPRNSHSFALFAKVADDGRVEARSISWLPKRLTVDCTLSPPEPGVNYPLLESLAEISLHKRKWERFGPFEIKAELYDRAKEQARHLEAGEIKYQCIDSVNRPTVASNCMHAITDIDMDDGLLLTGPFHGIAGSRAIAEHFERWILDPTPSPDAVAGVKQQLGLPSPYFP